MVAGLFASVSLFPSRIQSQNPSPCKNVKNANGVVWIDTIICGVCEFSAVTRASESMQKLGDGIWSTLALQLSWISRKVSPITLKGETCL